MTIQPAPTTVRQLRDHGLLRILQAVHRAGAPDGPYTRSGMTRQLGISRGAASNLVGDLRARKLVDELDPIGPLRPGRPTSVLSPHPDGPLVVAADITHDDWQVASVELGGGFTLLGAGRHRRRSPGSVLGTVAEASQAAVQQLGRRVVGMAVAAPGTFSGTRIVQASNLGWSQIDLGPRFRLPGVPLTVGNDATLAGVAESRRGAARHARFVLHLHVHNGVGGALLSDGSPIPDAQGAGGEFGHMPLGSNQLPCGCGAIGCWDFDVDGRALLRAMDSGEHRLRDARGTATAILSQARGGDPRAQAAVELVAGHLGRGIGALVNAHDPQVVTLSGTGADLVVAAPQAIRHSYLAALMLFRRGDPPALLPTALGDSGRILGAAELAFDRFLTPEGMARWSASHAR